MMGAGFANAHRLAIGLACIPGIIIQPEIFQTNIVFFEPPSSVSSADFVRKLDAYGVRTYGIRTASPQGV